MPLLQLVPSRVCLQCDVCCRFPEAESFLRPYFTAEEIQRAVARGINPAHFPDPNGSQVSVVPNPSGEGYLCPAFDPATSHCRIYDDRPLDCQIYPLAVMWGAPEEPGSGFEVRGSRQDHLVPRTSDLASQTEGRRPEVVLGWDTKCPFLKPGNRQWAIGDGQKSSPLPIAHDPLPGLRAYADKITELLERDETIETFANNPRLIGRFQEDVVILNPLLKLSARMRERFEVRGSGFGAGPPRASHPVPRTLHPLTLGDRNRFERAVAAVETPLAHFAFAPHVIWGELFRYSWAEREDHFCLFAEYSDGIFMPLPPLPFAPMGREVGSRFEVRDKPPVVLPRTSYPVPGSSLAPRTPHLATVLAECFAIMRKRNKGSGVSRIENVPEEWVAGFEAAGYQVKPKDSDYLYRTADLAALAGDRYKSQRAACNRFEREHRHSFEPYQDSDRDACLTLFREWAGQKQTAGLEEAGRHMLADSESAHREALTHHRELGLAGHVVRVDGTVRAYTFGYERTSSVLCVLLEVADRTIAGLATFIFRGFAREAAGRGYELMNTMDDSGLPSLAHSKRAYHPLRLVPSYIATEV